MKTKRKKKKLVQNLGPITVLLPSEKVEGNIFPIACVSFEGVQDPRL